MRNKSTVYITQGAVIAALYVVLTLLSQALGFMSFDVQFRLSEALCVLPLFTAAAVPGLAIGCLLTNIVTACAPWDVVFGSLATFIGAALCRLVSVKLTGAGKRKLAVWLSPLPNILANTAILPFVIKWVYASEISIPLLAILVFAGEVLSCALGIPLAFALDRSHNILPPEGKRR